MIVELKERLPVVARHEPRTSLFVMATLYADSGSWPIKVRDMSSVGALIEGAVIPLPGTSVRVARGTLSAKGEIVWCRGLRAGLRFDARLSVSDWLPGGRTKPHQHRVDELLQEVREGLKAGAPPTQTLQSKDVSGKDLLELEAAIVSLAEDLAADADVVLRHVHKLQTLDLAAQTLRKLAIGR